MKTWFNAILIKGNAFSRRWDMPVSPMQKHIETISRGSLAKIVTEMCHPRYGCEFLAAHTHMSLKEVHTPPRAGRWLAVDIKYWVPYMLKTKRLLHRFAKVIGNLINFSRILVFVIRVLVFVFHIVFDIFESFKKVSWINFQNLIFRSVQRKFSLHL